MKSQSLFEGSRLSVQDSISLTVESLCAYAERYRHWVIAFSGGKDSSATVTLIAWLIKAGLVPKPASLTVLYSDTRIELTPLQVAALGILRELESQGVSVQVVMPEMDDRFFVYMFGRGVPPPSNTFRWCTPQLKIEPMQHAMEQLAVSLSMGRMEWHDKKERYIYKGFGAEKLLTITGVRLSDALSRPGGVLPRLEVPLEGVG